MSFQERFTSCPMNERARSNARLVAGATFAGWLALATSACGSAPSTVRVDDSKEGGAAGGEGGVRLPEERDASVDAAPARCRSEDDRYAFVTRDTLVGTFARGEGGGAAWRLADEFCQQQATKEHRCLQGRNWRAWLSGEGLGSADSHVLLSLYPGGIVRQTDHGPVTIAPEAKDLLFGFQREEIATVFDPAVTVAWTGTRHDTTVSIACGNWTGGDDAYRSPGAVVGDPSSALGSSWTENGAYRPCSEAHPIYCFEAR